MLLHHQLWLDFATLCSALNDNQYTTQCTSLHGATIGEHLRHSYEFYQCLLDGIDCGTVNYETRQRNTQFQNNRIFAIDKMETLAAQLVELTAKGSLQIISKETNQASVQSSVERELIYCLDHAIHHQALIKIGLKELGCATLVNKDFGVAYSTIRYRTQLQSKD